MRAHTWQGPGAGPGHDSASQSEIHRRQAWQKRALVRLYSPYAPRNTCPLSGCVCGPIGGYVIHAVPCRTQAPCSTPPPSRR